ncbi:MAG: hypothetical protein KDA25_12940 [Phycisphaerales bacterium]|nr:hypothetical protein [Phycisphaerales bacterium]
MIGAPDPAAARCVVLGASNVARALPTVVAIARSAMARHVAGPVDLHLAVGCGRSYGRPSRVLGRGLSGILETSILGDVAADPRRPCATLLTDVGNDIMYEVPPALILDWVERCVAGLVPSGPVVLTALAMASLRRVTARRYRLVRRLLFPSHDLPFAEAMARCETVDAGLREIAARHGAIVGTHDGDWYGIDPIHLRARSIAPAFATWMSAWAGADAAAIARARLPPAAAARLRLARCASWSWRGHPHPQAQPTVRFADGSTVHLH